MANNVKKSNRLFIAFAFVFSLLALPAIQTVVEASGSNAATVSVERTNGEAIVSTSAGKFEEGDTAFDLLMQVTNGEVEYDESEHGDNIRFMLGEWTMTATVEVKDAEGQAILPETGVEVVAGSNAYDALPSSLKRNSK